MEPLPASHPSLDYSHELVTSRITGKRLHNGEPNALHSIRVGNILKEYGCSELLQHAGILHDIVEDSEVVLDDLLEMGYHRRIIEIVRLCSHDLSINDHYARRKNMIQEIVFSEDLDALMVKSVDSLDNRRYPHLQNQPDKRKEFLITKPPLILHLTFLHFGSSSPIFKDLFEAYFAQVRQYNKYF